MEPDGAPPASLWLPQIPSPSWLSKALHLKTETLKRNLYLIYDTACDKVMKTSGMGGGDLKGDLANNHLLFSYALFSIIVRI